MPYSSASVFGIRFMPQQSCEGARFSFDWHESITHAFFLGIFIKPLLQQHDGVTYVRGMPLTHGSVFGTSAHGPLSSPTTSS